MVYLVQKKVFIVGKTYPNPSKRYRETTCIGGITDNGEWIRLYPVPFRHMNDQYKFRKYDWITVDAKNDKDVWNRRESHKIVYTTIKIVEHVNAGSDKNWEKRNAIILPLLDENLEKLMEVRDNEHKSMGMIKVTKDNFNEIYTEERGIESDVDQITIDTIQKTLNGGTISPLEIFPFKFKLDFYCCGEKCNGHKISCFDWEMLELYRNMRKKYDSDIAVNKVKEKIEWMFDQRDVYLMLGTEYKYNNFIIGSIYYPPKMKIKPTQASLY